MTTLPANPLPPLADEMLAALPALMVEHARGPSVVVLCESLGADAASVRGAARQLDAEGRAIFMRYKESRAQHLVPIDHDFGGSRICAHCRVTFERPKKSKRKCCSQSCAVSWSWTIPGSKEKRAAGIRRERQTPEARARATRINNKRWARPGERQKLSEQNRKRWADPVARIKQGLAFKTANGTPEKRKFYSDLRKKQWQDPKFRAATIAGIRRSKQTPEARAKFAKLLKDRWADPVMRAKYTAANAKKSKEIAERHKGKKQSAEQVRKRVESTRRTRQSHHAEQHA